MATFIEKTTYGGDFDSQSTTTDFLKDNDSYQIPVYDVYSRIARDVFAELQNARCSTTSNGKTVITSLDNLPDITKIMTAITEKSSISMASKKDAKGKSDIKGTFDGKKLNLHISYFFGQVAYDIFYHIRTIAEENVRYFVTENFNELDIPISRFYQNEFCSEFKAQQALETMSLHEYSRKEMVILDAETLSENPWYIQNRKVIDILKTHPELNIPEHFRMHVKTHLAHLNNLLQQ